MSFCKKVSQTQNFLFLLHRSFSDLCCLLLIKQSYEKIFRALQFFCSLLSIIYLNENKYYENVRTCLYFVAIKRFSCLTGYIYAIKRLYSPSEDHALTLEICLISALYFLFVMLIIETKSYVLTKKLVCETFFVNI